jgi:hypothetical protein
MAFDFTSRPPRPRKGDSLFRSQLPDERGGYARLGSDPDAYTLGYRRAAEQLSRYALANQRECNSLAYPIVFLYRHHIELALKRIIYCVPWVLRRDLTDQEKKNLGSHRLDLLWADLEPIFESICDSVNWSKPEADDLEGIREYVSQLSAVDPLSMNFRYWKSKKGAPSLPDSLNSFNLRHFSEMIGRLADFIEALDTATTAVGEMRGDLDEAYDVDAQY